MTSSSEAFRSRRSVLYMPSSNERALEKAKSIACDGLILDLEDAVAPDAKVAARHLPVRPPRRSLRRARSHDPGERRRHGMARRRRPRCVRGRSGRDRRPQGELGRRGSPPGRGDGLHDAPEHTKLWAMLETPYAMLHAEEIASASDRLTVLVMGTNDLAKELYAEHVPGRQPLLAGLGLVPAGRPRHRQGDPRRRLQRREEHRRLPGRMPAGPRDGLRRQDPDPPRPGRGRQRGLRPVRRGSRGRPRILQAWEDGAGSGVVTYDGRMIENLHVDSAQRTLTIHDAIRSLRGIS